MTTDRASLSGSFAVELALRKLREQPVGVFLFLKCFPKKGNGITHAEFFAPGDERAVAGNLVVLDGLCSCEQPGIKSIGLFCLFDDLLGFLDQTFDARAAL